MRVFVRFSDGEVVTQFDSIRAFVDSRTKTVREFQERMEMAFAAVADQYAVKGEVAEAWIELDDGRKILLTIA